MPRQDYLNWAAQGMRMPIGSELVLREQADSEAILLDGRRLGAVVADAARRYRTPLAIPVMDLTVEKAAMLSTLGVAEAEIDSWHFAEPPAADAAQRVEKSIAALAHPRVKANIDAIEFVAGQEDLVAAGMAIGPFSLVTKLLGDPITPVFLAGSGSTAGDDDEVKRFEAVLELATRTVVASIKTQLTAGAKGVVVCEPAANKVYFSPNQLDAGSDIFERYVMRPNRRVAKALEDGGCDLIFHCCGELIDSMLEQFTTLRPAMLSLGSSRKLWEDARLVPKDIVLYGNLPSKKFYSDGLVTVADVKRLAGELIEKMKQTNHPFILGSECDVLSVKGSEKTIRDKVAAFVNCCG